MSYYTLIIIISIMTLGILCILVRENARLSKKDKITFYMTYVLIAVAAISEWTGVMINGKENIPSVFLRIVKCSDYIFTPLVGALFVEHMKLHNKWRKILIIMLLCNTVFQVVSIFTGWMTVIDENNQYSHGIMYRVYVIMYLVIIFMIIIEFSIYGKSFSRQNRRSLYAILFLLVFGILSQEILGNYNRTAYISLAIGAVLMFIHYTEFSQLEADELLFEQQIKLRETDALIEAKYAAEEASRAKSDFLANMSHEIRTPINAVLGMNEMILRECDDPNVIAYSDNIRTAGTMLLGLINDILDFSKIEAGKIEIIPVEYDMSSLINDLVNMVHTRADDKGLEINLDFDKDMPKILYGDEVRIKQVITNLLTNAVKYTEKGSVTFRINYEKVDDEQNNIILNVSVEDTGIGIKAEDLPKLFSEFERIEERRNRNVEGTGLGMTITKSLLELMGSSLKVESTYGKGSRFYFSINQRVIKWEKLGDYATSYRAHLNDRKKYHESFTAPSADILVVDDNPMNLMVFKSLVKQTLVKTDIANDGDEGLRYTHDKKYDIIFLDFMMPGKDGIETLHELKSQSNNPNLNTPVVCLTANAISGAREEYLSEGFDDYLTKPINPERLENMLKDYIPEEKINHLDVDDDRTKTYIQNGLNENESNDDKSVTEDNDIDSRLSIIKNSDLIDTAAGISNSGTKDAYLSFIKIFYESAGEKLEELQNIYDAQDYTNYTIKVHALKSSLRIIGATDIGEHAQLLENAGKSEDIEYINGNHTNFVNECKALQVLLEKVLYDENEVDSEEKPLADKDQMKAFYDEMKEAAEEMDYDILEEIFNRTKEYTIPNEEKDKYNKVKNCFDNFDYEGIVKALMMFLCVLTLGASLIFPKMTVRADAFNYNTWLTNEQAKYPAGKYWNHAGMTTDNSEGYTGSPCTLHATSGVDHIAGTNGCTCNHFGDPGVDNTAVYPAIWHLSASQCMGFANKVGYDLFGSTKWSRITAASDTAYATNIRVGDIVRISGHTSFVISKTDSKITVGECNYVARSSGQGCLIAWGREIDLSKTTIEYYERAQNYDGVIAGTIEPVKTTEEQTTEQATTEGKVVTETGELFTGWKLADDGEHYIYYKKGEAVTEGWLTVKKKKYYIDENNYRVTGLYEINDKNYYFNEDGVLVKAKWVTQGGNTYYIGNSGYALKSQWLYKGKALMYVKSNGVMAKSELVKIAGSTYLFNSKGKRSAGFKKCKGKYYYCNSYGIIWKKQWITKGKKRYYVDKSGVRVQDKLVKIVGKKYYFNNKGVLVKNKEVEYDGKLYKADRNGVCKFIEYLEEDETEEEI